MVQELNVTEISWKCLTLHEASFLWASIRDTASLHNFSNIERRFIFCDRQGVRQKDTRKNIRNRNLLRYRKIVLLRRTTLWNRWKNQPGCHAHLPCSLVTVSRIPVTKVHCRVAACRHVASRRHACQVSGIEPRPIPISPLTLLFPRSLQQLDTYATLPSFHYNIATINLDT